ncbi:Ppx/GppA phosphatase family protein [Anaeromyxobacter paludicola]|uniref:Hydrolase n=1 Tax=Anaeromyxobacter paludicola TaxID=2918171 RepID=A0ABM7XAX9_9BACT|nr:Ppx/GppA phosphatase family protein [Anaeromyxobacter paludicola]BDG09012.1 hydrolase [Anaeromyxobacter paludicola]
MSDRAAAIDVGTNTVLLLVAERREDGTFAPLVERAEITRLGRGVDRTGRLDPAAIRDTVTVVAAYAAEARALGAARIACVATSAARDAANSAEFFDAARDQAGLVPEVISGDEEARLVYASAWRDFGILPGAAPGPLAVVDVGGGSTEVTFGDGPLPRGRQSLQVGAVRLTERHVRADPLPPAEARALREAAAEAMRPLAPWRGVGAAPGARLVGVAGTVTTLSAVSQGIAQYDAGRVHGAALSLAEVERLYALLAGLTVAERARLPGMEPKRADVIVGGCAVVAESMRALGFDRLTVSDRGVRWGLLYDRADRG